MQGKNCKNNTKLYQAIKEGCPLFIIYAYDNDQASLAITAENQITANTPMIRTYFNGVFPR